MVSQKFMVNSDAGCMAAARYATETFAGQIGLNRHDMLRLDLLVEETLGMAKAMLEDFYGQIWLVSDGKACEIHFEATANMNADRKAELLKVSTNGKNASARGFMAKLGELVSRVLYGMKQTMDVYGQETIKYGIVHLSETMMTGDDVVPIWTLQAYRSDLDQARVSDEGAEEAWDELEKSIVAKLADDVVVGIKGDRIDLVIKKRF